MTSELKRERSWEGERQRCRERRIKQETERELIESKNKYM
jgi:hypothetical protein